MARTALIYRDVILPPSEASFMRRQYSGFSQLDPLWIGRRITPVAAESALAVRRLGGDGWLGDIQREVFKDFGLVPDLSKLQAMNPAVIHAQFGRGGALALPIARRLGLPLAVTFHGGDAHKDKHYRGGITKSLYARRLPALLREAKLFICVSESVRQKLLQRGFPAGKLIVHPIGTDIPADSPAPRAEGPILFVGRFVPKKGLPVLIEALQILRRQGQEPAVRIIGDGPLASGVRLQAEGLARVDFLGWQRPDEVALAMRQASMLIVPSERAQDGDAEGLPSVATEAMALSLPVIGTDQAGLEGVVLPGRTGLIVPARDPEALARGIASLIASPEMRMGMGTAGRGLVQGEFNARRQSQRLESLLLSLTS
ncbi:glycosyltransferase [Acidisoma cellulosilytica]|uniref:Glycosyltransferase n=1 Tax=Acidisoma cellulosilyticum TaxID=2802395 RepID=A0A964E358_9PROT|nr:glycosyltransferase [Acidisoma cellulosilyticum]MCB8880350.1 glycosyltransferase [Acidisoma cellulosilyticum]